MKNIILTLVSLIIFSACQQEENISNSTIPTSSRSLASTVTAEWPRLTYALGGELIDIRYVNAESGSMDAGYCMHTDGSMVMEVTLYNSNGTNIYKSQDFYLVSNACYPFYHKTVTMYENNSFLNPISSFTLQNGESKTIYFHTYELFKEGIDEYSYPTTPPFTIYLYHKNTHLLNEDLDVKNDTRLYWEKYR